MSKRIMNFLKNMRKSFTENPRGGLAYSNSSGRSLNRYNNAHKTRKDYVLAPACLAKSHRDAIFSREGLSELLPFCFFSHPRRREVFSRVFCVFKKISGFFPVEILIVVRLCGQNEKLLFIVFI